MKKRLTGKPACVVILSALIIISLLDTILRGVLLREASLDLSNAGEPLITALFALMLLLFAQKGKDRLFYICTGGFLFYFVLKQLFGLPNAIARLISLINIVEIWSINPVTVSAIVVFIQILTMLCIVAIGGLLVEYMNDGSIYNKAFNFFCITVVLLALVYMIIGISGFASGAPSNVIFSMLNNLSRMTMVFLFVFFAYDTAKRHLAKIKL